MDGVVHLGWDDGVTVSRYAMRVCGEVCDRALRGWRFCLVWFVIGENGEVNWKQSNVDDAALDGFTPAVEDG
jgi:hypothetical protein